MLNRLDADLSWALMHLFNPDEEHAWKLKGVNCNFSKTEKSSHFERQKEKYMTACIMT